MLLTDVEKKEAAEKILKKIESIKNGTLLISINEQYHYIDIESGEKDRIISGKKWGDKINA